MACGVLTSAAHTVGAQSRGTMVAGGALARAGIDSSELEGSGPEAVGTFDMVVAPLSSGGCTTPRFVLCSTSVRLEIGGLIAAVGAPGQRHIDTLRMGRAELKLVHRGVDPFGSVGYLTLGVGRYRYALDLRQPRVSHGNGATIGGGIELPIGAWLPFGELQIRIMDAPAPRDERTHVVTGASILVGLRKVLGEG
jgi:hypothetical protein